MRLNRNGKAQFVTVGIISPESVLEGAANSGKAVEASRARRKSGRRAGERPAEVEAVHRPAGRHAFLPRGVPEMIIGGVADEDIQTVFRGDCDGGFVETGRGSLTIQVVPRAPNFSVR